MVEVYGAIAILWIGMSKLNKALPLELFKFASGEPPDFFLFLVVFLPNGGIGMLGRCY